MKEKHDQGPATRTVSRAMAILYAFDESRPEMGVTEISQRIGLDKSTVYRLLSALQQGGLIAQDPETAKYHLGLGLLRLAGLARQHLDLPHIARPYMKDLAARSQETVNLSVMTDGDRMVNVEGVDSPRRVRNVQEIGREMPLHAVSEGKVMMAYMPAERLDQILARGLPRITERTIDDPSRLQKELAQIRRVGYSMAEEELEMDLGGVAAPIWSHEGQVIAVLSVSGPSWRMSGDRLAELGQMAKETADQISEKIGYIGGIDYVEKS